MTIDAAAPSEVAAGGAVDSEKTLMLASEPDAAAVEEAAAAASGKAGKFENCSMPFFEEKYHFVIFGTPLMYVKINQFLRLSSRCFFISIALEV